MARKLKSSRTPNADTYGLEFGRYPYDQDAETIIRELSDDEVRGLVIELAGTPQMHRGAAIGALSIAAVAAISAITLIAGGTTAAYLQIVVAALIVISVAFVGFGTYYVFADPDSARRAWAALLETERAVRTQQQVARRNTRRTWFWRRR